VSRKPLDLERFIGWLSIAVGASAFHFNDSIFYRIVTGLGFPMLLASSFVCIGLALVISTYTVNARCRIVLLVLLGFLWLTMLTMVVVSGPLGAFGYISIVVVTYISWILYRKVNNGE
jgi:hypothetical protein